MKRKNRGASASASPPEGKKKKVTSQSEPGSSTSATKSIDYTSPTRVLESLLAVEDLGSFIDESWEKKPLFVKRENTEFYGPLFTKKDLEGLLKKEEIQFIEDVSLSRYVEGKTELLNEESKRVSLKDIKAAGVAVQFHQPDRFKDEVWRLIEALETYYNCLVACDIFVFQPGSQGLAPQFDELETFILQLEGKTKWKLFKPLEELPQESSPDLELSDLGDPTDEFDMAPGDLLYFPRGTVYFPTPIEDKDHVTYMSITTFEQNSWGNFLTSAVSKAVDKAMECEVEYRRGLPINIASLMGSWVFPNPETEEPSEENGDQKTDAEDADKKPANPRTAFNENLVRLLKGLLRHLNPDKVVDETLRDFFGGRLPPYEKETKKGKKKSAPTDDSKIKLLHPDHVRFMIGDLSEGVAGADGSDEEMSEAEEEGEDSEEEASEESEKEDKKGSKKGGKKQKAKKTEKTKETKKKSKKAESEDEDEEEEGKEDEDDDDEQGSGDENEGFDNEDGGDEYILVLHSVNNDRTSHMMGDKSACSVLRFPFRYKEALKQIESERDKFIAVKSLQLDEEKDRLSLVKSLWNEGLLDME